VVSRIRNTLRALRILVAGMYGDGEGSVDEGEGDGDGDACVAPMAGRALPSWRPSPALRAALMYYTHLPPRADGTLMFSVHDVVLACAQGAALATGMPEVVASVNKAVLVLRGEVWLSPAAVCTARVP
jgi:hypothetical protein